jgi:(p)ppGpp synthase/HD superfamily hydrolase
MIKERYGAMVERLVDLLSKQEGETENKDAYWKRILAEPDLTILWRVLAIKYADRIHNARTFKALKEVDRDRKVKETLEWFPVIKQKLEECLQKLWVKRTVKNRSRLHLPDLLQNRLNAALEPYLP